MGAGRPTNEPGNYFALGKQSAKDTEATTFTFLRHLDGTAMEVQEEVQREREGGDGQEVGLIYKTSIDMDGQAVFNSRPEVSARVWAWTLGADSVGAPAGIGSTASGVANEHTAVPTSTVPYLTAEQFWADQVERSPNVQITELELAWEQGRPFKVTPKFIGGGSPYSPTAAQSPTRETGPPFYYPLASVVLDGAANTLITKGRITIKRGVDDGIRTIGLNREDVVALNFDTDAELTVKYDNATASLYDKTHFGGAGGSQIPFDLATTSLSIYQALGAGTNARYMQIGLNALNLIGARANKLDPEGKTMYADLSFAGYKSATHQVFAKHLVASVAALT